MPLKETLEHPAVIAAVVFAVAVASQWILGRTTKKLAKEQYLTDSSAFRLRSLSRAAIFLIALFVGLQATGAMGHAWAVLSAIIAALAVGFVAVWSLLSNVTSALVLLGMRPFRIGDSVEVYEGDKVLVAGEVLDLNLFFTTLGHGDSVSRVPNNLFFQKVVRVIREGTAPDPSLDSVEPFYSSSSNPRISGTGPSKDKS